MVTTEVSPPSHAPTDSMFFVLPLDAEEIDKENKIQEITTLSRVLYSVQKLFGFRWYCLIISLQTMQVSRFVFGFSRFLINQTESGEEGVVSCFVLLSMIDFPSSDFDCRSLCACTHVMHVHGCVHQCM